MRPRLITRSPGTRTTRVDTRQRRIESLAAEFALLAQRRARVVHQMDLLDQQRDAAEAGFNKLQARMAWLAQKMDALDPELRESYADESSPAPPPPLPAPPPLAHTPARAPKPAVSTFAARTQQIGKAAPGAPNRAWKGARPLPGTRGIGANKYRT